MTTLLNDVRLALRTFLKRPGFTIPIVITLALGIGANTAVFTVVYHLLLKPFPFPEPDRVVAVYDTQLSFTNAPFSADELGDCAEQNRVFAAFGGIRIATPTLTGSGQPERVRAARVTASFSRVFGAPPILGRWFTADEDVPGGANVAVLGEGLWTQRFGRDRSVLGRSITLDGVPRTIVGVAPDGPFEAFRRPDVFVPLAIAFHDPGFGDTHWIPAFARLKPGVSLAQARREMVALGRRLAVTHRNNHGVDVQRLRDTLVGKVAAPVVMLFAMVSVVLLIACANVANLLLARATSRRREIAVRVAMGAGRLRLARQMLAESTVLAVAGGAAGIVVAWLGVRALASMAPASRMIRPLLPMMGSIALDWRVLLFSLGVALTTGLLFGLAPLVGFAARHVNDALKEESGRSSGSRGARRMGSVLVVAEIALSVVLLSGAGLLVKSLVHLADQRLGFAADGVLSFDVALPQSRYASPDSIQRFHREALARLRSIPRVAFAGMTTVLPLGNSPTMDSRISIDGKAPWKDSTSPVTDMRFVAGDYFEAMKVPLIRGRLFNEHDDGNAPAVAVVSQTMAAKVWPGEDAIGKRVAIWGLWRQVVGIVGDVRSANPAVPPVWEVSVPAAQQPNWASTASFVVRASGGDPLALVGAVRRQMTVLDPSLALGNVQKMDDLVSRSLGWPRLLSVLASVFAGLAALLASIGTYGLIAYTVGQRRWEFGVRMAMGADRWAVIRLVLGRGMALAATGVLVGVLAAIGTGRALTSLLYEVRPNDPWVLAGTCFVVLATAVAACLVPARTASRVDPIVTLRAS